jgi:hypothetical protein
MALDLKRTSTSGRFLLEVGNSRASFLKSFSGFAYEGEHAKHEHAPENFRTKQLTTFKYSDAKAKIGMNQTGELAEWIKASFKKQCMVKSGSFTAANFDYKATHRIEFRDALMKECAFPKLEGNSKEPGYMDITFQAEDVQHLSATGETIKGDYNTSAKMWQPWMFRLEIAGLEDACKRVASIDPLTFKQAVVRDDIGPLRIPTIHAANVDLGNLKITFSAADAKPWADWADAWFRQGKCLTSDHRDGCITFLGPGGDDVGRIELKQLGMIKFDQGEHTANAETVKRVTVEMYLQEAEIFFESKSQS